MEVDDVKTTRGQEVYTALRRDLLQGRFPPGSRLKLSAIGERFGVSLSVIRESMARLTEQGLVVASPQRGFRVADLSIEDLKDLTRARVLLETLALSESIAHGDLTWESNVMATHHRLDRTPFLDPYGHVTSEWGEAHSAFHRALLAGCGTKRLEALASDLRDCSTLYQYWSRELAHDTARDVAAEHREIVQATIARDAQRAVAALQEHIERTTEALIHYAEERSILG